MLELLEKLKEIEGNTTHNIKIDDTITSIKETITKRDNIKETKRALWALLELTRIEPRAREKCITAILQISCEQTPPSSQHTQNTKYDQKIPNVCHAIMEQMFRLSPLVTAKILRDEITTINIEQDIDIRPHIIAWRKLIDHNTKRTKHLQTNEWYELLVRLENTTSQHWKPEWDAGDGRVVWKNTTQTNTTPTSNKKQKHMLWNPNGIRPRWREGNLVRIIKEHDPDTLAIPEIKTNVKDIESMNEFKHTLEVLGYKHCIWNSCSKVATNNTERPSHYYGIAVFSKQEVTDIQFGVGDKEIDREGRTITGTINNMTIIWTYNPCSGWNDESPRTDIRKRYDIALRKHYKLTQERTKHQVFISGDMNIAHRINDRNIRRKVKETDSWPSCRAKEIERHDELLQDCNLEDTYYKLHGETFTHDGKLNTKHHSWTESRSKTTLRVDHMLTPKHNHTTNDTDTMTITECYLTDDMYGSDHKALITVMSKEPHADISQMMEEQSNEIDEQNAIKDFEDTTNNNKRDTTTTHKHTYPCKHNHGEDEQRSQEDEQNISTTLTFIQRALDMNAIQKARKKVEAIQHTSTVLNTIKHDQLPTIMIPVGTNRKLVEALLDSGAGDIFISANTARDLNLTIKSTRITVKMGDNRGVRAQGITKLPIQLGNRTIHEKAIVLNECPNDIILGDSFFRKYKSTISYKDMTVSFTMPGAEAQETSFKFHSEISLLYAAVETILPKQSGIAIRIKANSIEDEASRWGITESINNNSYVTRKGTIRLEENNTDKANYIEVFNPTNHDITIEENEPISLFSIVNFAEIETVSLDDDTPTNNNHDSTKQQTESELDKEIKSKPHLTPMNLSLEGIEEQHRIKLKKLILKHERLWDTTLTKPIVESLPKCDIVTKEGAEFKGQGHTQLMNPITKAALRKIIQDKLKREIITESKSACSSSVRLVPKPGGGVRFCVDYRILNKSIKPDAYTLPSTQDQFSALAGNKYFTSLDMKEAFWTVPLTKRSQELTAFRTPDGLFMYKRMPMGLKTASAMFCRFIDNVLGDLKWESVLTYIDDLLIASKTMTEHITILSTVFDRLDKANITLGAKKCHIATDSVKFLGHIVSEDGVRPDPQKTLAIEQLQIPKTKEELEKTLGIMGYYRRFIRNYSAVSKPLRDKLTNVDEWKAKKTPWSKAEIEAFNILKNALKGDVVCQHPDWDQPFELHTDACHHGLGAVLSQRIEGKEHVIAYASRAISKQEAAYSTWELEALAMIWSTRLFRMYLYSNKFTIITDSEAAKQLIEANDKGAGGRLLRWRLALDEFDFEVKHRKGLKHCNADALSRLHNKSTEPYGEGQTSIIPVTSLNNIKKAWWDPASYLITEEEGKHDDNKHQDNTQKDHIMFIPIDNTTNATNTIELNTSNTSKAEEPFFPPSDEEAWTSHEWSQLQNKDNYCAEIIDILNNTEHEKHTQTRRRFKQVNKLLLKTHTHDGNTTKLLVVPTSLRAFILARYHSLPITGHKGVYKTYHTMRMKYYWPKMHNDIKRWIRSCLVCIKRKATRQLDSDPPGSVSTATAPHQEIALDLIEASTTSIDNYRYILSIMDLFTRYATTVALKTKTAKEVAQALFKHLFTKMGRPQRFRSDKGKEFIAKGLERIYKRWNIIPITTGGYSPWRNPVERYHRYFNSSMTILSQKFGENWTSYMDAVTFGYNASHCRSTNHTPFYLTFGRHPTLLEDLMTHAHEENNDNTDFIDATKRMKTAFAEVRAQQEKVAEYNRKTKAQTKRLIKYDVNDSVLYWEPVQVKILHANEEDEEAFDHKAPSKWKPKWTGPHRITNTTPGKYSPRYDILHYETQKIIKGVKSTRLHIYHPWSTGIPSTSRSLDRYELSKKHYEIGTRCREDDMVIIPTNKPWPFGIGKVTRAHDNDMLEIHWYGGKGFAATDKYKPMWFDTETKNSYSADKPKATTHTPFTNKLEELEARQADVAIHSFRLTKAGYLTPEILEECSNNPDIWWTRKKKKAT